MAKRNGAIHVATTRRKYKDKVYTTTLLRRTYREEGKVKHQTLGNISHLPDSVIELIRRALKGESFVAVEDSFECVRSLPHGHVAAVLGTLRKIGLERVLERERCPERDRALAMIAARVIDPRSKLATVRGLCEETAFSSLGQVLELGEISENELYAAMDWLLARQGSIEKRLAKRHLKEQTLVLYDITSSYFEGRSCPLARLGHSRDGKKGWLQIVFGLLCNGDGCPVAVEVFEGNTADPQTVAAQVEKLRTRFGLERVVLVGDRGMLTSARLREDLEPHPGLRWVTALRSSSIQRLVRTGQVDRSLFDETDLAEITSPEFPGERLIVCYNPLLADERARKREELLEATEKRLQKIVEATQREKRPLRGKEKISLRVGKVANTYKVEKHFGFEITETSFRYWRKKENIEEEAALDGLYVIRTNVEAEAMDAEQTVLTYKRLSTIERAFRSFKSVDLKVRPIFHRTEDRVKAHIFLCMLAYYVEWHMRQALAPLLFDDDDRETASQIRASPVAPAQRSPSARSKAHTKRSADGGVVHSFRTLLMDLQTISRNTMHSKTRPSETFEITTIPTPTQQKALDLLGVSLRM